MARRTRMLSTRDASSFVQGSSGGPGILGSFVGQQQQNQQQQQQLNLLEWNVNNPNAVLDQTIQAQQQNEILLLLTENQHLVATHVALRQELLAAQQEGQKIQALLAGVQSEKDEQVRALLESSAKLEADLRANEPLKVELQQALFESKRYTTLMHDLNQQLRTVAADFQRCHLEAQQIPALKAEVESLRQDVQQAKNAYEYEKSVNGQYLEQTQLAEKNLVAMAREVESARAQLTNLEKQALRFNNPSGGYDGVSKPAPSDGGGYNNGRQLPSDDYAAPYARQGSSQWGYETQTTKRFFTQK